MVMTVGHSTHPIDEFLALLRAHNVCRLVDVRSMPRSRRNPQFNLEELPNYLRHVPIGYAHMPKLGGLRRPRKDSVNTGWRNPSFRGYADYMQTHEFEAGLRKLIEVAAHEPTAIMCAESVPWRCHRSLIADALLARGIPVFHIVDAAPSQPHKLTPFALVAAARVTYPSEALSLWGGPDSALEDTDPCD